MNNNFENQFSQEINKQMSNSNNNQNLNYQNNNQDFNNQNSGNYMNNSNSYQNYQNNQNQGEYCEYINAGGIYDSGIAMAVNQNINNNYNNNNYNNMDNNNNFNNNYNDNFNNNYNNNMENSNNYNFNNMNNYNNDYNMNNNYNDINNNNYNNNNYNENYNNINNNNFNNMNSNMDNNMNNNNYNNMNNNDSYKNMDSNHNNMNYQNISVKNINMNSQQFMNQNMNNSNQSFHQNNYNNQNQNIQQNQYVIYSQRNNNLNKYSGNHNNFPPSQKSHYILMPQQFINNQNIDIQENHRRNSFNIPKNNNMNNHQQYSQINFNQNNMQQYNNTQNENQQVNKNNQNNYQQKFNQNNANFNQQEQQNQNSISNTNNLTNDISNLNIQHNIKQNPSENNINPQQTSNKSNNNQNNNGENSNEVKQAASDLDDLFDNSKIKFLENDNIMGITESIPIQFLKEQKKSLNEIKNNNNDINIKDEKEEKMEKPKTNNIISEESKVTNQEQAPNCIENAAPKIQESPNFLRTLSKCISKEVNKEKFCNSTPKNENDVIKEENTNYNPDNNSHINSINKQGNIKDEKPKIEDEPKKDEFIPKRSDQPIFTAVLENESSLPADSVLDSVQLLNELPGEIHNHALIQESIKEKICTLCLKVKSSNKGYKCNSCPLIICDECANKIVIYHYSNSMHEHSLCMINDENCQCNKCNKNLFANKNFYFNCKICNFNLCLNCYYPERSEGNNEETPIHQHPLKNISDLNTFICNLCENEIKGGGCKCFTCELTLCKQCANNIYKLKRKKELHEHPLFLVNKQNWKCCDCENSFKNKAAFNCNKCSLDFCDECYLE